MTVIVLTGSRDWQIDKAPLIWDALRKLERAHENDWHWSPMETTPMEPVRTAERTL